MPIGGNQIVRAIVRLHQHFDSPLAAFQYDRLSFYRSIFSVNRLVKPAIQKDIQI